MLRTYARNIAAQDPAMLLSWRVIPIDLPSRPQGPEDYELYERGTFERWSGTWSFPSAENVESHDLDLLKWRPSENSR